MESDSGLQDRLPAIDTPLNGDNSIRKNSVENYNNEKEVEVDSTLTNSQEVNLDQAAQIIAELEAKVQQAAQDKRPPSTETTNTLQNIIASKQFMMGSGTVNQQINHTPTRLGSRNGVKAPNTNDRELPSKSPRAKAHIRDQQGSQRAKVPSHDANLAYLLSQASETNVGFTGGELEREHGQMRLANRDEHMIRSPEEVSPRRMKPERDILNYSHRQGKRKHGLPGQLAAPGGRQQPRTGGGARHKKNVSPTVVKKSVREVNLYQVQLEDHLDDLTQELSQAKDQLAAWKLRYYVEYFRLDGTKKYVKELQDQQSIKDQEIARLNSYIDNIVEQNQQRVDFFASEMENKEQLSDSLQEYRDKVSNLEKELKDMKESYESEGDAHKEK